MSETNFTKGELIIQQDEHSGDYEILEDEGDESFYIVAERISSIHDANLFKVSNKMYRMLECHLQTLKELYPSECVREEYYSEFQAVHNLIRKTEYLLAEARGE